MSRSIGAHALDGARHARRRGPWPSSPGADEGAGTTSPRALLATAVALLLLVAACAPTTGPQTAAPRQQGPSADASPVARTAWEAWHLMEIGHLRDGVYATNVLVDLSLPQGVRWTVIEFADDDYVLRVSEEGADTAYRVTPAGVDVQD